ncbi:MAG: ABC transporter substrate-binding protein [Rhodospirillales bacterium]|nr:ABC transporter substrate-binding protein [Rhodospirillales bacterium]
MIRQRTRLGLLAAGLALFVAAPAEAETLKVASSHRGVWDTSIVYMGNEQGFFKAEGLELEILWTSGSGETQQAVVSGSVDVGVGGGTMGVMGAFVKGAPVRIISACMTGASDTFWYVKADSPIKSFADVADKTVAVSTNGSSAHLTALALIDQAKVKAKTVPTGSPPATLIQAMSGQVDVGWSLPPIGFEQIEQGKIRIIGRGQDVPALRNQTVRNLIANANATKNKRDALVRFLRAYQKTIDWAYTNDKSIEYLAEGAKTTVAMAKRTRDEFYPKDVMRLGPPKGLEDSMRQAVEYKYIPAPLTEAQQKELFEILINN